MFPRLLLKTQRSGTALQSRPSVRSFLGVDTREQSVETPGGCNVQPRLRPTALVDHAVASAGGCQLLTRDSPAGVRVLS